MNATAKVSGGKNDLPGYDQNLCINKLQVYSNPFSGYYSINAVGDIPARPG
jgi:hypothetical protein